MKQHCFKKALLSGSWSGPVQIDTEAGIIQRIRQLDPKAFAIEFPSSTTCLAVPGMTNVHSHAFQHAFAGLSEYRTHDHDSFWTWRQQMYRFVASLTPDKVFEIGKRLYSLMRAAGYSAVGEFHYLHHQPNGRAYDNVNAMADALIQAALEVGMKICMLPVLYQRSGFDNGPLETGQLRFGCEHDQYLSMLQKLASDWLPHESIRLGFAIHSLRAVSTSSMTRAIEDATRLLGQCPIHIHIAEQQAEVEACLQATGMRPVEFLLESFDVGPRWCLIHATHMTPAECAAVAESGAIIGVCPTTEANLGDGVFMAESFLEAGGKIAIGSDSHISLDPCEELRLLEYAQRLTKHRRAILSTPHESCGELLYRWAAEGGARAVDFGIGSLEPLQPDLIGQIEYGENSHLPTERALDYAVFHSSVAPRALKSL